MALSDPLSCFLLSVHSNLRAVCTCLYGTCASKLKYRCPLSKARSSPVLCERYEPGVSSATFRVLRDRSGFVSSLDQSKTMLYLSKVSVLAMFSFSSMGPANIIWEKSLLGFGWCHSATPHVCTASRSLKIPGEQAETDRAWCEDSNLAYSSPSKLKNSTEASRISAESL